MNSSMMINPFLGLILLVTQLINFKCYGTMKKQQSSHSKALKRGLDVTHIKKKLFLYYGETMTILPFKFVVFTRYCIVSTGHPRFFFIPFLITPCSFTAYYETIALGKLWYITTINGIVIAPFCTFIVSIFCSLLYQCPDKCFEFSINIKLFSHCCCIMWYVLVGEMCVVVDFTPPPYFSSCH